MRTPSSERFASRMLGSLEKVGTSEGAKRGWETRRGRSPVEETPGEGRRAAAPEEVAAPGQKIGLDWLPAGAAPTAEPKAEPAKKIPLDWLKPAEIPRPTSSEESAAAPRGESEAPASMAGMTSDQAREWADGNRFTGRTKVQRAEKKKAKAAMYVQGPAMMQAKVPSELQGTWSEAANATSNAIGAKAVEDTKKSGREHGWFVDAETGEPVGNYHEGGKKSVELSTGLVGLDSKRSYITGHTHPVGVGPSPQDLMFFMAYPQLSRMAVHDVEGNVYEIEKPADWDGAHKTPLWYMKSSKRFRGLITSNIAPVQAAYLSKGENLGKTKEQINADLIRMNRDAIHKALETASKEFGLTYRMRKAE